MLPSECRERLEALEQATARLANLNRERAEPVERALEERARAVQALASWIESKRHAAHPLSPELARRLALELERGADLVVRFSLDREGARLALAEVARGLQLLHGLKHSTSIRPPIIDCQG
jgi:hypothetical protein